MNWLDLAVASPSIGIQCEPRLQFPHEMLDALKPTLAKWKAARGDLIFHVPSVASLIQIKPGDGFICDVLGNGLTTTFAYQSKVVDKPASLPTITNPSVQRFSDLLSRAIELSSAICERLSDPPVVLTRLGIVADCRIDEKAMPPGVTRFLEHVGKPWQSRPVILSGVTTVDLPSDDRWTYRCHHAIDINSVDRPEDVRVKLDWQMFPKGDPRPIARGNAQQLISEAAARANKYFERFGGGGLAYGA